MGRCKLKMCFHGAGSVRTDQRRRSCESYRFWLLAQTVQNLSLNLSSATMFFSACASFVPSMPMALGSAGGGGGGGGVGDAACCCCCRALKRGSRGSAVMVLMTRERAPC